MIDFLNARTAARQLAAVGEPTRLLILYRLTRGPHHVGELADLLGVPMVNMSHHLGVLRNVGLVEDVKFGRHVMYQFNPEQFTPAKDDGEVIGTLSLGFCRLDIRKSAGPSSDGATPAKKSVRKK